MTTKVWFWLMLLLFSLPSALFAQTIVPAGKVGGQHWTREGSPYLIQGDIIVDKDSTLTIGPGVQVIFQGYYYLRVALSCIRAVGAYNDSIRFTVNDTSGYYNRSFTGWNGLHFLTGSSEDTSILDHVIIEYGKVSQPLNGVLAGGGIYAENFDKLKIIHSSITNNLASSGSPTQQEASAVGGGLYLTNSPVYIDRCIISNNEIFLQASHISSGRGAGMFLITCDKPVNIKNTLFSNNRISSASTTSSEWALGGGLYALGCSYLLISGNTFINNQCWRNFGSGGGIYLYSSKADIINNRFIENISNYDGGGIYVSTEQQVRIINNLFFHNMTAYKDGAGLNASSTQRISLINNTFASNAATGVGGGIFMRQGFRMVNCIFKGNTPDQISLADRGANDTITSCNIEDGMAGISVYGGDPPGYPYEGVITGLTQDDPQFSNIQQWDATLLPASPCINAGTPDTTGLHLPAFCFNGIIRVDDSLVDLGALEYTANQPPYDLQPEVSEVPENQDSGYTAAVLQTLDPDSAETFTFTFENEAPYCEDNTRFYLSANRLYTAESLDYEVDSILRVCLLTTDSRGHTYRKNIIVKVLDRNDPPLLRDTLPDISVLQGSSRTIHFDPNIFYDQDFRDSLTFTLQLMDTLAVPSWIGLFPDNLGMDLEFCSLIAGPMHWRLTACDKAMACVSDNFTLTVLPAGYSGEGNFLLFPNPGGDFIRIQSLGLTDAPITVALFTPTGQKVSEEIMNTPQITGLALNAAHLRKGLYFIHLNGSNIHWVKPWLKI